MTQYKLFSKDMAVPKVISVALVLALVTLGKAGGDPGPEWNPYPGSGEKVLLEKRGVSFIKSTNITITLVAEGRRQLNIIHSWVGNL
jgi:hypothetical protein